MLHLTIAIPFIHKTSDQCCFNVGPASQTVIQHSVNRETSQCIYWAFSMRSHFTNRYISICLLGHLHVFPFHKQIYICIKVQKLSGDLLFARTYSLILSSIAENDATLSQQRDKSMCVLGTPNTITFDKQIYIFKSIKAQWGLLITEI